MNPMACHSCFLTSAYFGKVLIWNRSRQINPFSLAHSSPWSHQASLQRPFRFTATSNSPWLTQLNLVISKPVGFERKKQLLARHKSLLSEQSCFCSKMLRSPRLKFNQHSAAHSTARVDWQSTAHCTWIVVLILQGEKTMDNSNSKLSLSSNKPL